MNFLKDTKLIVSFLISITCAAYAAGSKTTAVSRADFDKHEKAIASLREGAAVHEEHDRNTDNSVEELRKTNQAIYEIVIGIAQHVGVPVSSRK